MNGCNIVYDADVDDDKDDTANTPFNLDVDMDNDSLSALSKKSEGTTAISEAKISENISQLVATCVTSSYTEHYLHPDTSSRDNKRPDNLASVSV